MPPSSTTSQRLTAIHPVWAVEGGRITIEGSDFPMQGPRLPEVRIGDVPARLVYASSSRLIALVPPGLGGRVTVRVEGIAGETAFLEVGSVLTTGIHQVDNPLYDRDGNLYVTFSGARGQQVPVSIFRVDRHGTREPFVSGIVNATSMALDPQGRLYVSSRFEGAVYRVNPDGQHETVATDLGIACGLAFGSDGTLFVGDRTGAIFRVSRNGTAKPLATLPASVAAFHLALGPDDALYVTGPTMGSRDHVYRVAQDGNVERIYSGFGRPQGLAFDEHGVLHVVEALAGASGVYRLRSDGTVHHVVAAADLVGLAFDPTGGSVVASNQTVYRFNGNYQ